MKKALIIGMVIVLIAGAAGGYWFFLREDDATANTAAPAQQAEEANQFNPATNENVPMIATITTKADGETNELVMKFDGEGNSEYTAEQAGQQIRFVITADTYYMCNDTGCYKYANAQEQANQTNPDTYDYNQADIDNFRGNATYKGTESCGSGTCDVWEVTNFSDNGSGTFYLETDSKRIVKIESSFNGSTTTIDYEYTDVTIEIPEAAEELPAGI